MNSILAFHSSRFRNAFSCISVKKTTTKTIGTHSGQFHADEALAVFLLRLTENYRNASVVRSRDEETLKNCDIIVDVFGLYDGNKYFDHHQLGFNEVFSPSFGTKLSSAGLIYKHFGKEIVASRLSLPIEDESVTLVYDQLYEHFIEAVDAYDNGISAYRDDVPVPAYNYHGLSVASLVAHMNPQGNALLDAKSTDAQFEKANNIMGEFFLQTLDNFKSSWLPARRIVVSAMEQSMSIKEHRYIMILPRHVSFQEHLFDLEKENNCEGEKLYVLYPEKDEKVWRIQAVPISKNKTFQCRKPFPEAWRGLRNEDLSEAIGIAGGIFVCQEGSVARMKTFFGAMKLAQKALLLS